MLHHSRSVVRQGTPAAFVSPNAVQVRSYYDNSSEEKEDDRIFPVYVHPVSKVVLQHLQDVRYGWLCEQGLNGGLQIKSNGTFLLKYPGRKGSDQGKIW